MKAATKKRLAVNLLLAIAALLAAALIGELALRLFKPRQVMVQRQPAIYLRDDLLGSRYRPGASGLMHRCFEIDNVVHTNSLGFHDVEHEPASGALHVAAIGDSFTAAFEVPRAKVWTQLLQRQLRVSGFPGAEVVNLGQDHSGTDVHLEILKRYLEQHQPGVVLLAFYENDIDDIARGGFFRETVGDRYVMVYAKQKQREKILQRINSEAPGPLVTWCCDHFYTCRLVRAFATGEDDLYFNNIVGLKGRGKNRSDEAPELGPIMEELLQLSREREFVILVIPVPPKFEPRGSVWRLRDAIEADLFQALGVVNVFPVMERMLAGDGRAFEEMYWNLDAHFNEYGNEMFARVVFEAVEQRLACAETGGTGSSAAGDADTGVR